MPEATSEPRVLVTGCGGFVAGALLRHLRQAWPRAQLTGLARRASAAPGVPELLLDLNDTPALCEALQRLRPDVIFHAAGRLQGDDWALLYRDNVQATLSLLDAVGEAAPNARTVIVGSAAECGMVTAAQLPVREDHPLHPVSPYGVSKGWQTLAARSYAFRGCDVVVARAFNLTGAGMPANTSLGAFAQQLREIAAGRREPVLRVGTLTTRRDFIDIDDLAAALCTLAERGRSGEVYNVCSGRSMGIDEALARLIALSGLDVRVDAEAARVRAGDVPEVYGSADKIAADCGWAPRVTLDASLAAML